MPPTLDEETVRHVASLARLKVCDEEVALFSEQLSAVLDYVAQLNKPDTTQVPPAAHPLRIHNAFRDDAVRAPWDSSRAVRNAPQRHDAFFAVPKVLDPNSD